MTSGRPASPSSPRTHGLDPWPRLRMAYLETTPTRSRDPLAAALSLELAVVRIVIARCSVDYAGRLSAHLAMATRLLIVKADSSVLVHSDGGSWNRTNALRCAFEACYKRLGGQSPQAGD